MPKSKFIQELPVFSISLHIKYWAVNDIQRATRRLRCTDSMAMVGQSITVIRVRLLESYFMYRIITSTTGIMRCNDLFTFHIVSTDAYNSPLGSCGCAFDSSVKCATTATNLCFPDNAITYFLLLQIENYRFFTKNC